MLGTDKVYYEMLAIMRDKLKLLTHEESCKAIDNYRQGNREYLKKLMEETKLREVELV